MARRHRRSDAGRNHETDGQPLCVGQMLAEEDEAAECRDGRLQAHEDAERPGAKRVIPPDSHRIDSRCARCGNRALHQRDSAERRDDRGERGWVWRRTAKFIEFG
jgi:hypothetical protein